MRSPFLIVLMLVAIRCSCQEISYRQFTVKDGLPGSIVYYAVQDSNGFIWFATNQGVSRFDGRVFKNYTKEDGLPDNDILKLFLDRNGDLWFISFLGIPSVLHNNRIIRLDSCRAVRTICQDEKTDSIILMSTDFTRNRCGYYSTAKSSDQWRFNGTFRSLTDYFGLRVLRASSPQQTNFLFSCENDTTQLLIVEEGSLEKKYKLKASVGTNWLPFSGQQNFSLSNDGKGLVFLAADSLFYANISLIKPLLSLRSLNLCNVKRSDINSMYLENDTTLWICTRNRGLLCIHNFMSSRRTVHAYFSNTCCTSVFRDRENGYWITTHSDGVFYLPGLYFHTVSAFPGLADKSVRCIQPVDSRHIIAGYSNGNLMILDNVTVGSRIFPRWAARNKNNRVMDVKPCKDRTLLVGTDAGLYHLRADGVSTGLLIYKSIKELLLSDSVILAATSDGVRLINMAGKDLQLTQPPRASCITGIRQHYYWGSLQGMYETNGTAISNLGIRYPSLSGIINHIDKAPDSTLWICTEQGIAILRAGRLTMINKDQGLSSNLCKHICFDDHIAWVSTDKGISRIAYSWEKGQLRHSVSTITEEDGLSTNDVNQTLVSGDYVWAATARGISFFSRKYICHPPWLPLINITRIVDGDTSMVSDTILLSPQKNRLLIELSGISYRSGRQIAYEYRLNGLDSNWIYAAGNSIELSRLPFGQYVFEARAIDRWGKRSLQIRRIVIIHSPHFWQTSWFFFSSYLAMALLIGAGFYTFYRRRQKKKENEYALQKKMQDLEMMALRAQMNPHFIFNCLSSIHYYILKADVRNAAAYLHKFSTLIRKTLQNSTMSRISLREEISLLHLYLQLEKMRFDEKMDYHIITAPDLNQDLLFIPTMIIQPYVENAIKHGIGTLQKEMGFVHIRFTRYGEYIQCDIEDNGPGIETQRITVDPDHISMGASITERRIDTLNLLQKDKIKISVTNKARSAAGNGTLIQLFFPIVAVPL